MIDIKKNIENFPGEKLDFLPKKYFKKFVRHESCCKYDHATLFRDKDIDYFVISLYSSTRVEKEIQEEGFIKIDPVYSESCTSYCKKFVYNKTSKVEELK